MIIANIREVIFILVIFNFILTFIFIINMRIGSKLT